MKRLAPSALTLVLAVGLGGIVSQVAQAAPAKAAAGAGAVVVKHTSISKAERGKELVMRATITAAAGPYLPTLYYRPVGETRYYSLPMLAVPGALNIYAASVPGIFVTRDLEYYIESYDTQLRGPGTAGNQKAPIRAKVVEPELPPSQIVIRSDPPDAALKLDGAEVGRTPWIGLLKPGPHELLLSKEGYLEASTTLDVPEGRDLDTLRVLSPKAEQATFVVTSEPAGASVRIDGQLLGNTPVIAPSPDGEHVLTVEKQGYARATRRMLFSRERSVETAFTLTKLPPEPALAITTEPSGATVTVDGKVLGKTPFIGVVPAGDHALELKLEGRRRAQAQIMMPDDRDLDLRFTLERADLARKAFVAISTEPTGADVFIDGRQEGRSPYRVELPPGAHVVKLEVPGFKPYEKKFTMPDGNDLDVTVAMVPIVAQGPGGLDLSVSPIGAEVSVDGKPVPVNDAGLFALELPPGPHVASVSRSGYRTREERFTAVTNQVTKLGVRLSEVDPSITSPLLTIQSVPEGAQLSIDGQPAGTTPFSQPFAKGSHRFTVTREGFKPREESFELAGGSDTELGFTVTLEALRKSVSLASAADQQAEAERPKAPVIDPEALAKAKRSAERTTLSTAELQACQSAQKELERVGKMQAKAIEAERELRQPRLVPLALAGAGVVAGAVGGLFGWLSMQDAADLKAADVVVDRQELVERHDLHAKLGIGLGAGGVALAAVGAIWAAWPRYFDFGLAPEPSGKSEASKDAVFSVAPTSGGATVAVGGAF